MSKTLFPVWIDSEDLAKLKEKSKKDKRSIASYIREAISKLLGGKTK